VTGDRSFRSREMRQDSQKPLLTSKIKHPSIHLNPQSRDHEIRQYNRSFLHTPIIINRTFILLLGVIYISMMEAMFNDWASHYVGTCDLSFAVAKCPHGPNRQCADETSSFYMVDDDTSVHSLASTSSRRSVKFAENVVSNVVEGKLFFALRLFGFLLN